MRREKYFKQLAESQQIRVVRNPDRLGVIGFAGANLFICRVGRLAASITGFDAFNAFEPKENGFGTPETTAGKFRIL
jgi:hypothetical protein